jgi:hypothetical protein
MRPITMLASSLLIAAPLLSIGSPARAADNDFVGQAQRFLNKGGDDRDARNSYDRGREDEMRRQQAEQDRNHYRRERDADRDDRYREPNSGYSGNYR